MRSEAAAGTRRRKKDGSACSDLQLTLFFSKIKLFAARLSRGTEGKKEKEIANRGERKMNTVLIAIEMIGGLVMFLYGMNVMGDALKKASGGKLEMILETLAGTKLKGFLLGMLVTAVIQSSGATVVMVVGFVNSQIMTLEQGLGIILGANIGTSITAWLLSTTSIQGTSLVMSLMKPKYFAPIFGLIGLIMTMVGKKDSTKHAGNILIGLAVLLMGMTTMSSAASPLTSTESFQHLMTTFSNPLVGMIVGLIATVILQSSSASIGVLQAISNNGTLGMSVCIPLIMGAEIGSATTGVIGSVGASRNGRRAAMMQMFYCIIKAGTFMILFYTINAFSHIAFLDRMANPVVIALFHSGFNIIAACLFLPVSDVLVWLVKRAIPMTEEEKQEIENRRTLQILDDRFLSSPAFALDQCKVAAVRMSEHTMEAMRTAIGLIFSYDEKDAKRVDTLEQRVDEYEDRLETYLVRLSRHSFSKKDSQSLSTLLHCINDFERITDHALNIMQVTEQMQEKKIVFSEKANAELQVFTNAVLEVLQKSFDAFRNDDLQLASQVEPLEEVIDGLNMEIKRRHVRRLRKGKCTVDAGFSLSDLTTDLERVSDHCSNVAVCLLSIAEDGFDTHEYLERIRTGENNAVFVAQENGYEEKYRLPSSKREDDEMRQEADDARARGEIAARTSQDALNAAVAAGEKKTGKKRRKKEKKSAS